MAATLTFYGGSAEAQQVPPALSVVERLPDGDLIITVNGQTYRAITRQHAERLITDQAELDTARVRLRNLEAQVVEYEKLISLQRTLVAQIEERAAVREKQLLGQVEFERFRGDAEHGLRLEYQKQAQPGRFKSFLNSVPVRVISILAPIVISATRR